MAVVETIYLNRTIPDEISVKLYVDGSARTLSHTIVSTSGLVAITFPTDIDDGSYMYRVFHKRRGYVLREGIYVLAESRYSLSLNDGTINALTSKTTPVNADVILIEDSADGYKQKKALLSALPYPSTFGVVTLNESVTPGTPASGKGYLYSDSDSRLKYKSDSKGVYDIGSRKKTFQNINASYTTPIDVRLGCNAIITLYAPSVVVLTGAENGDCGVFVIKQNPSNVNGLWVKGHVNNYINLTTRSENDIDVLEWWYDGTDYYWDYKGLCTYPAVPTPLGAEVRTETPSYVLISFNAPLDSSYTNITNSFSIVGKTVTEVVYEVITTFVYIGTAEGWVYGEEGGTLTYTGGMYDVNGQEIEGFVLSIDNFIEEAG